MVVETGRDAWYRKALATVAGPAAGRLRCNQGEPRLDRTRLLGTEDGDDDEGQQRAQADATLAWSGSSAPRSAPEAA